MNTNLPTKQEVSKLNILVSQNHFFGMEQFTYIGDGIFLDEGDDELGLEAVLEELAILVEDIDVDVYVDGTGLRLSDNIRRSEVDKQLPLVISRLVNEVYVAVGNAHNYLFPGGSDE